MFIEFYEIWKQSLTDLFVTDGILDSFSGINMQDHQSLYTVFVFICVCRAVVGLKFLLMQYNLGYITYPILLSQTDIIDYKLNRRRSLNPRCNVPN